MFKILLQFAAKADEKPEPTFVGEDFKEGFNEKMKWKICIASGLLAPLVILTYPGRESVSIQVCYVW